MNNRFKLKGIIRDGFLKIANENFIRGMLEKFNDLEIEVECSVYKAKRSNKQNNWYWGPCISTIIEDIKEQTGDKYTKEEIHEWHLAKVVKPKLETKIMLGETIIIYKKKATSEMNTEEFNIFKDAIQRYWSERDIIIPDPQQKIFINDVV